MDNPRVLVVDDDDAVRSVVCQMLEAGGFDVLDTDRGERAIDLAQDGSCDVVLLDVNMPEMSGMETCIRLRQQIADQKVIFMTGDAGPPDLDFDHSNTWVLNKPFRLAALIDAVKSAL